ELRLQPLDIVFAKTVILEIGKTPPGGAKPGTVCNRGAVNGDARLAPAHGPQGLRITDEDLCRVRELLCQRTPAFERAPEFAHRRKYDGFEITIDRIARLLAKQLFRLLQRRGRLVHLLQRVGVAEAGRIEI